MIIIIRLLIDIIACRHLQDLNITNIIKRKLNIVNLINEFGM